MNINSDTNCCVCVAIDIPQVESPTCGKCPCVCHTKATFSVQERRHDYLLQIEQRAKRAAMDWNPISGECPPEIAHGIKIAKYILTGEQP